MVAYFSIIDSTAQYDPFAISYLLGKCDKTATISFRRVGKCLQFLRMDFIFSIGMYKLSQQFSYLHEFRILEIFRQKKIRQIEVRCTLLNQNVIKLSRTFAKKS